MVMPRLTYDEYLAQKLQSAAFRQAWAESESASQLKRLRIEKKISQAELARRVGTKQPSIARLESGYGFRNLTFLKKVADALDATVEIRITPKKLTAARNAGSCNCCCKNSWCVNVYCVISVLLSQNLAQAFARKVQLFLRRFRGLFYKAMQNHKASFCARDIE